MKKCNHCKLPKELTDFGKDKHQRDGLNPKCRVCCCAFQAARKTEKAAYDKEYRILNADKCRLREKNRDKEQLRLYKLKAKFALSKEAETALLEKQQGKCAVCLRPEWVVVRGKVKRLAVDHNKTTGRVRALLCNNCNRALGMLYENPETIKRLLEYILHHNEIDK